MRCIKNTIGLFILIISFETAHAQLDTYTVDNSFNTAELFRGSAGAVLDFHFLDDGRILVGGVFDSDYLNGMGMIYSNGQLDNSWNGTGSEFYKVLQIIAQDDGYVWPSIFGVGKVNLDGIYWLYVTGSYFCEYLRDGTASPYTVEWVWDIYQMENSDLLLGGAIANDTLQPNVFRGIARIHADGSHDPTFPALDITPNINGAGAVHRIFRAPDGAWYISGGFTAINGHETNRLARLTPSFEVDTNFVSPLVYTGFVDFLGGISFVDSQSRVWVTGDHMQLLENPNDTIQLIRLLPTGEVDPTFLPRNLKNSYPDSWIDIPIFVSGGQELANDPGKYILHGQFNYFNDTLQPCITVVDDAGNIQHNYFQGQGATINFFNENSSPKMPRLDRVVQLDDGGLLIGGGFSQFMGETHYNVVKLKQGFVGVEERNQKGALSLYPNPASDKLHISLPAGVGISGSIYNAVGMQVLDFSFSNSQTQVDIRKLESGIYFVKVELKNGKVGISKFVKTR